MSFEEFVKRYENLDGSYEYWGGEVIQKPMGSWIHGILQIIIGQLLREAGYISGSEVTLRLVPDYYPKPDIVATKAAPQTDYPSQPVEVIVEILSESNDMRYMLNKCKHYSNWGCEQVYIVDPLGRDIFRWIGNEGLKLVGTLAGISAERIWRELDKQLSSTPPK